MLEAIALRLEAIAIRLEETPIGHSDSTNGELWSPQCFVDLVHRIGCSLGSIHGVRKQRPNTPKITNLSHIPLASGTPLPK